MRAATDWGSGVRHPRSASAKTKANFGIRAEDKRVGRGASREVEGKDEVWRKEKEAGFLGVGGRVVDG